MNFSKNEVFKTMGISIFILLLLMSFSCKGNNGNVAVALNGVVNFVQGQVFVESDEKLYKLSVGDIISQNMVVITKDDKSMCDIYISDSVIRITGNSKLKFDSLSESAISQKVNLYLENGSVLSKVVRKLKKDDVFEIRTPTAVAAVRGTQFSVTQSGDNANIACSEGKVSVTDPSGEKEVVIGENEEADVEESGDIVKKQISEDNKKILETINTIDDIQDEIQKKYEDKKNEIKNKFEEQKKEIEDAVDNQVQKDTNLLENQKAKDTAKVEDVKNKTDEAKSNLSKKTNDAMEEASNVDTEAVTGKVDDVMEKTKPDLDSVTPDIN